MYSLTGRETVTVNIGIIEDSIFELTEVFYASLSFTSVYSNVTIAPNRTEIVISDDGSELMLSTKFLHSVNRYLWRHLNILSELRYHPF